MSSFEDVSINAHKLEQYQQTQITGTATSCAMGRPSSACNGYWARAVSTLVEFNSVRRHGFLPSLHAAAVAANNNNNNIAIEPKSTSELN
jgi:hypothetical protein